MLFYCFCFLVMLQIIHRFYLYRILDYGIFNINIIFYISAVQGGLEIVVAKIVSLPRYCTEMACLATEHFIGREWKEQDKNA